MTKEYICAEQTADGPRHFVVDSKETFDSLVHLSAMGSDEAEMWGGFEFDIYKEDGTYGEDDEDDSLSDVDGRNLVPGGKHRVITAAIVAAAHEEADLGDECESDTAADEAAEDAYLTARFGI